MHLVVFEGPEWADLAPLTLTRPAFRLLCGSVSLLERQVRAVRPTRLTLWVRDAMAGQVVRDVVRDVVDHTGVPTTVNTPLDDAPALLLSAAAVPTGHITLDPAKQAVVGDNGGVHAAVVRRPGLLPEDALRGTATWAGVAALPRWTATVRVARHWADLMAWNADLLRTDAANWPAPPPAGSQSVGGTAVGPHGVHTRGEVSVLPGVVFDTTAGPILLDRGCVIGANAVVEGPVYVGPGARVAALSLVHAGTTLGPGCRVGGEVSNSVFLAHTNKSHYGYVGDSYLGAWVNCGAGTTTSNLKSTYGPVRLGIGPRQVETGRLFLGAAVGDHAKLATNTLLPAGGYVGVASAVALSGRVTRGVGSFRFVTDAADEPLQAGKAHEIAARMMQRRGVVLDEHDRAALDFARAAAGDVEG